MSDSSLSSVYGDEEAEGNNGDGEVDYYAILNVPKDASIEEVNKSYRQKCLLFHPDRHKDPSEKRSAEKYFVKLRKAHETLSDPKLRAIYDTVGVRGLKLSGWELIPNSDTGENIRRKYEFLKRLRETEIMLERVHPSCSLSCKTNFTGVFTKYEELRSFPQMTGMSLTQNVECTMTPSDKISLSGQVKMNDGKGDGGVIMRWRRIISSATLIESSCTFAPESIGTSCKWACGIFNKTAIAIEPSFYYLPLYSMFSPGLIFIFSRTLHPRLQGSLIYHWGLQPSLTTSLMLTEFNQPKVSMNLTVSPNNSRIKLSYTKHSLENDSFVETSCAASLMGVTPTVSYERRLSKYSRIGCSISFSFPNCFLNAKFKLKTGLSHYEYQILLCDNEEDVARATLYGIIVPFIGFYLFKGIFRHTYERILAFFDDPAEEKQVDVVRREEAMSIVNLMRRTAERIAKEEEQKDGLVILEAKYGELLDEGNSAAAYPLLGERIIDVTIPLQAMVNDSQLRIYSAKGQLPGFYDPCPSVPKMLRICYNYRGRKHVVSVPDEIPLHIPMMSHRVSR